MAKDDYFVIAYSVLKYLYDCLKSGTRPSHTRLNADLFGIDDSYWVYIIAHLYGDGYIEGVTAFSMMGGEKGVKLHPDFGITPKGIEYLSENSLLQKAKIIAKDIRDILPI